MTYVVTESCIKCKYTDCVDVCPVECFREGENMVIIDPTLCIDCGVCEPECPIGAIKPEAENLVKWIELASDYSKTWPIIPNSKIPLKDADLYKDEEDKFEKYFSANPGN